MFSLLPLALLLSCAGPGAKKGKDDCAATDTVGDGVDDNCDGIDGIDADGDGVASFDSGGEDCLDDDASSIGIDADLDGAPECVDCNDADPTVKPGEPEICDGLDQDCEGTADLLDGVGVCTHEATVAYQADILLVIDNSCSMHEEQVKLAAGMTGHLEPLLDGVDAHIGVVSTDMLDNRHNGNLIEFMGAKWVDNTFAPADALIWIDQAIRLGTLGSYDEQGLAATYAALEVRAQAENAGFMRDEAELIVLVLSDEDDHSINPSRSEFIDWMVNLKEPGINASFHGIISPPNPCPDAAEEGANYADVIAQVGGETESICADDYSTVLADILLEYVPAQVSAFYVPDNPVPETITLSVTEQDSTVTAYANADLDWDAETNQVSLKTGEVPSGATVVIHYALAL